MARGTPRKLMADRIFLSADVLTMSADTPRVEAVAIRDDQIIAMGSNADVLGLVSPQTEVVECGGRCLVPGFHDAHIHLLACASKRLSVDCGPQAVSSIAEIQQAIRRQSELLPIGEWIRAGDYDEFYLAERRHPTRCDLDVAAPNHPVKLQHRSHHACVLNSPALKLAGIDERFSPPPGARIEVDASTGEPTGLLFEMEDYLGQGVVTPLGDAELSAALGSVLDDLLSNGVTAVQEATAHNGTREWRLFRSIIAHRRCSPRITFMVGQRHLTEAAELGLGYGRGDEWLRIGPVKVMLTEAAGDFCPAPDELFAQVWEAHRLGHPVAIHAVEESAVCLALEAIAAALARLPCAGHRHRLEHASIAPPALLDRAAELGVGVATQPGFIYSSGRRYLAEVEEHWQGWLYPLKSMLDRGIIVGAGSDAPVAPAHPLRSIYAAVARRSREGDVVGPGEKVSVERALWLHTWAPAWLAGLETQMGCIAPGRLADLALLSANPLKVGAEEIKNIEVEMTVVGGQIAWERS